MQNMETMSQEHSREVHA